MLRPPKGRDKLRLTLPAGRQASAPKEQAINEDYLYSSAKDYHETKKCGMLDAYLTPVADVFVKHDLAELIKFE